MGTMLPVPRKLLSRIFAGILACRKQSRKRLCFTKTLHRVRNAPASCRGTNEHKLYKQAWDEQFKTCSKWLSLIDGDEAILISSNKKDQKCD